MSRHAWFGLVLMGCTVSATAAPVTAPRRAARARVARVDPEVLAKIQQRGAESGSDAVVIYVDGKVVADWTYGQPVGPIETMSATKSIVNLAIGRLIDTGKIKSVDQPVHEFFPEWRQGRKKTITLKHLLNHTSGLQNEKTTDLEIYPSPDFVALALAAELADEPGTRFAYNNKAVNLLAGVVKVASGVPLDAYLRAELFAPLGITDFTWDSDRAGNPHGMSGLALRAHDLARVGLMLLDRGRWKGKQLISPAWIAASTAPGQALMPKCGLLWWLVRDYRGMVADDGVIAEWRKGGVAEDFIQKVVPLKDKVFTDKKAFFAAIEAAMGGGKAGMETWYDNTWRKGLPDGKILPAPTVGYYANGYLGQYLVLIPRHRIVAVRQRRAPDGPHDKIDGFDDFPALVRALVK